jgi:DNA (cytosine-5)-methyltransferase 1
MTAFVIRVDSAQEVLMSSISHQLTAVSLFCSSGIGDLALRAAGANVLVANEFVEERADLFRANYPDALVLTGDIRDLGPTIVKETQARLNGDTLDILFATPPCQGMSKNGRGKLLRGVRDGLRDAIDPRNQLATFVPSIATQLRPRIVVFENVPEMEGTLVEDETGQLVELLEYLSLAMDGYSGTWRTMEFADYGVPQRRQRLITIFVRNDVLDNAQRSEKFVSLADLYPTTTHAAVPTLFQAPWVSVDETIGHLPPLDASSKVSATSSIPFHYVPVLDERKYWWISNTPSSASAFDNQCINPVCMHADNPTHGASRGHSGINQARTDTPLYCMRCGSLLPRPAVTDKETGEYRIMKGFTSAYKRMRGDLPASAITTNLSYVCSDQKVHPTQHRALSLYEAMMLHTLTDYEWIWELPKGKKVTDSLIRDSLGESIPPRGLEVIFRHLFARVLGYSAANANAIKRTA